MDLLQITHFPVFPPKRGGDHRKHGLTLSFAEKGDTVIRFSQAVHVGKQKLWQFFEQAEIAENYIEYRYSNPFYSLHRLPLIVGLPYLFHGSTLRIWKPRILNELVHDADIIFVEEPWQLPAIRSYTRTTPIIYSSHNVEPAKFEPERHPRTGNWLQRIITHTEKKAVEAADLLVCTSVSDKEEFEDRYNPSCPIYVAPNGVCKSKIRSHEPENGEEVKRKHDISENEFVGLFVGSQYPPNNDAAKQIVSLIESHSEALSNFHLLVVGSVSDVIADRPEDVTLAGFVDEIEPYYDAADIALNPMRFGGGTNIKILDYFARSLPVLSTPFGMRGFERAGEEIAMTAELSEFPDSIKELQDNVSLRERLQSNGRKYVQASYTWESISQGLRKEIHNQFNIE